jgi:nitroreductase
MDIVDFLKTRGSTPWRVLGDPGPSEEEIKEFLAAAVTAPDHGAIRPWRFIVVRGDAREAMGEVLTRALLKRQPDANEATIEKDRDRMRRVPLLIVVAASITENHPKVPPSEQLVATGLAAQAILLAAQARGYGGVILTGDHAYDANVKAALSLKEEDQIVAFVYIGTPAGEMRPKRRPDATKYTRDWTGPAS